MRPLLSILALSHCLLFSGLLLVAPLDAADIVDGTTSFPPEQIEFFESEIRPLLVQHCFDCHSTDALEVEAGLYVDSREGMLHGGESGAAVVPGQPSESLLIQSVNYEASEMPPDRKLDPQQIEALTRWVEIGAPWPQVTASPGVPIATGTDWSTFDWDTARQSHWAWQSVQRPKIPMVDPKLVVNPIDNFVVARRAAAGLDAAAIAEPEILARRIYIDLIGVPPTSTQVQSFAASAAMNRQNAVETLVDELLASPMYGQRWGRHWLDVARYSDGRGGFLDNKPLDAAWRYRDWVVDVLNQDMPINEFICLQIAGDQSGEFSDSIATGFFALGPTYRSDGGDPDSVAQAKGETLDDRIDTLTRGLLGITGACARCHDHKFDPIPQQDYYSLAGIFNNTAVRDLPLATNDVVKRFNDHKNKVNELQKQLNQLNKKVKDEKRDATAEEQMQQDELQATLAELKQDAPPGYDVAHTLHDTGNGDMKVALRGNLRRTGDVAPRRFLRLLSGKEPTRFTSGSGRAELAAAIIDPQNPLTVRVFVNRVWMHHFGAGLVRTPSNFGTLGEAPTHPELLDWLADEFVAGGWSLKSLHRQIMTSATYQLSSEFDEQSFAADGDNRLLWRMSPRRMDVEAWRDSLLAVTGELDTTTGGPSLADVTQNKRRTLYAKVSRNGDVFESDRFLRRFDFPLMRATVAQRPSSIVPQQYLFLMNSRFMVERAKSLVTLLASECESDAARIEYAYRWLYNRSPEPMELELGLEFVSGHESDRHSEGDSPLSRWDRYAQVLLSSNEFMFVR
ncbi:secreted protein containing DUF1549 [Rhodopirellula maiorica SM1]|uniref:Secreted protein containing DUF1549 n=1 Tax=Rhodopirellula maiorica SM1 TaxID=1265738 RepID=M5RUI1_9BACT|nr:PSD1 and planctomycete cytochrome C domain-containing protein [Rhodopirellula maiorica]EMI19052.1 secreted protein containing DUF1549 [Rhodopirellula maiorica SM1]